MRRLPTFGAIALAALTLRLLWIGHRSATPEFTVPMLDAGFHHAWAAAWADGNWTSPRFGQQIAGLTEQPFFRPPGCAAFLAAHYRIFGIAPLPPLITQTLLGLLGLWLYFLLGNRLSRRSGLIAALLITLSWPTLCFSGEFLDPALLFPLVPASLLALVSWHETRKTLHLVPAGLAIGLAALVRPNALVFAPVAFGFVLFRSAFNVQRSALNVELPTETLNAQRPTLNAQLSRINDQEVGRTVPVSRANPSVEAADGGSAETPRPTRRLRASRFTFHVSWLTACSLLLLTLSTLLPILPVTFRNYARTGEFVLISSNAGINLFIGNNPAATGAFASRLGDLGEYNRTDDIADVRNKLATAANKTSLTEHETSRLLGARARAFIRGNPRAFIRLLLRKTLLFWGPVEVDLNNAPEIFRHTTFLRFLPVSFPILLALALASCVTSALNVKRSALNVQLPTPTLNAQRSTPNAQEVGRTVPVSRANPSAEATDGGSAETPRPTRCLRACSFITSAFSVKRSALNVPTPASTANCQLPTANCQLLLTLAFILAWFLSILPFFVSGQYRQPILPLLALLAAPYIDQLLSAFSVKRSALNVELQTQTLNAQRSTPNAHPAPDSHTPIAPHTHTLTHSLVLLHFRTLALLTIFLFLTHLNPLGYAPSRALPLYNAACSAKLQGDLADALARYRDLAGLPERIQASGDAPLRPNELAFCAMAAGNMGTLEFNAGNPYRAERAYRQAIAFEPGNANARANLGAALLAQGRHAEAEEVLLEVLLNDPARTYARLTLVQSLLAQGRRDAAAPHLRILAADPAAADGLKQIRAQHPELGW